MTPLELVLLKRAHAARLANSTGARGEALSLALNTDWQPRPKGKHLSMLLLSLRETGVDIKGSAFDALALPHPVDFADLASIRMAVREIVFIEVKTANQDRVKPGFGGFFFALTENELRAAEQLGERHLVALYNMKTGELAMTSVPEILARSRSTTWQVSVQL